MQKQVDMSAASRRLGLRAIVTAVALAVLTMLGVTGVVSSARATEEDAFYGEPVYVYGDPEPASWMWCYGVYSCDPWSRCYDVYQCDLPYRVDDYQNAEPEQDTYVPHEISTDPCVASAGNYWPDWSDRRFAPPNPNLKYLGEWALKPEYQALEIAADEAWRRYHEALEAQDRYDWDNGHNVPPTDTYFQALKAAVQDALNEVFKTIQARNSWRPEVC